MSTKKTIVIAVAALIGIAIISGTVFGIYTMNKNKVEKPKEKLYYNIGSIFCNIKDSNRILKCDITIEFTDEELKTTLEQKNFLIKNKINEIVRSKTMDEIEGKEGQKNLQREITENANKIYDTNTITNIYFNELIVQ